jgi:Raf kinase inhibitor-like YbhB/YbcL family protein
MPYDPYATSFPAPPFPVFLPELQDGDALPRSAYAREGNRSPRITWGPLPEGTRSLIVTAFDPDAPIPGGFWHWLVKDGRTHADGLAAGVGAPDGVLPGAAAHLRSSMGHAHYVGVDPPAGTGTHRLFVCAVALGVETLEVAADAGPAALYIAAIPHTLGRGIAVGTSQAPEAA